MQIEKDTIVTLHCQLFGIDGQCLDSGETPLVYLHGDYDGIFPPLERDLQGKSIGYSMSMVLGPEDAFGELEVGLIAQTPRTGFPENLQIGMQFTGGSLPIFEEQTVIYRVVAIDEDTVILDGNHPLAGKSLSVSCIVQNIRMATPDEIEARRPLMS